MPKQDGWRNSAMYCVIVGDIVNSRGIDPGTREKVTAAARNIFDRINAEYSASLMTTFGMVRGDAFEGVLLTQYQAPQIVQEIIKAFYRAEKTAVRVSVVLGRLTVTSDDRNLADGPAFHQAFDDLEKMKTGKSAHWLQVSFRIGDLGQKLVDGHLAMLKALTEGWTDKQREIVWAMEALSESPKLVGKRLGISPSVVNKQLNAASYRAYRMAWEGLTDYLAQMDEYAANEKPVAEQSYVPYFSVAMNKFQLSHYSDALSYMEKALEIAKTEPGESSTQLILVYNGLARVFLALKRYGECEKALEASLLLQEQLPLSRIQHLETLLILAELKCLQEEYTTAKRVIGNLSLLANSTLNKTNPYWCYINRIKAMLPDLAEKEVE